VGGGGSNFSYLNRIICLTTRQQNDFGVQTLEIGFEQV
jgi:hypothetical protein